MKNKEKIYEFFASKDGLETLEKLKKAKEGDLESLYAMRDWILKNDLLSYETNNKELAHAVDVLWDLYKQWETSAKNKPL